MNVSVIIPHYNRVDLLKQTLMSVKYQTYQDWEVIIVDDYSDSGCIEQIEEFIKYDSNIRLIKKCNEPKGASVSRNIGLDKALGRYVLFVDSDDVLASFALNHRLNAFENNKEQLHAVMAPTLLFKAYPGDTKEIWCRFNHKSNVLENFLKGDSYFNTMSALWDKSFLIQINGWNECLASYQDWELHIRALLKGLRYVELSEYDNFYRIASDEQSIAANYFEDDISKGRFQAFKVVYHQLVYHQKKHLLKTYRAFVLRQFIQLIEHDKRQMVKLFLKQSQDYGLNWRDKFILTRMLSDSYAWRYRRITKLLVQFFWRGLEYDPWLQQSRDKELKHSNIKALSVNYEQLLNNKYNS